MVVDTCILGWIGACVPDTPYLEIGQLATVYYFFFFLIIVPFLGKFEDYLATRVIINNKKFLLKVYIIYILYI